ncbi:MAG: hypothetical protein KJ601_07740 [Nanoarchaeota archaeon]|nr:hypothetical protein [Nanoarchaeota archaeon]MBU1704202.1 hypothetical protein [Nanoarchaeota archaeon]
MNKQVHDINLKLREERQLFNSFDPAPFLDRDLDDDAADYITDSVRELSGKHEIRLNILLPKDRKHKVSNADIKSAIKNHFNYSKEVLRIKLKSILKQGRKSLVIGILFLTSCISASELSQVYLTGFISKILAEGLIIAGWVAMWKPINTFLYEWWPITKEIAIRQKIRDMEVKIKEY